MSNSFCKTIIMGRLGMDPEIHQSNQTEYANFRIAHSTVKNGEKETQWHRICAFGKQAELCQKYLHKGDLCCIEGHLNSKTYEKDGQKRISHSIIAENITFMSPKRKPDTPAFEQNDDASSAVPF